jgi:N-formylglutamate amidohydrolase
MADLSLTWIPAGKAFDADDFVYFRDKGRRPVDDVLAEIDLILTGPHASAAFPEEMAPFVDDRLTRRLQHDFTDISTSPVGRRWAEIDPHLLYVENPHPRAVRDANRARPDDLRPGLKEAFARLRRAGETERPSLAGVDAIRPVTFGYLPVLRQPKSDAEWDELIEAMTTAGALGVDVYERVRDDLIERTINAKLARLTVLDPADVTVSEWRSASTLLVMSLHDTMNHTARPNGAICVERQPVDRLPNVVALSNHGGPDATVRPSTTGALLDDEDVLSLDPTTMRAIANAYRWAFDAHGPDDVAFNRPYLGGFETRHIAPFLRSRAPHAIASCNGVPVGLQLGVWQNEFLREFLLGPDATEHLTAPGDDWVLPPDAHVNSIAERLKAAHDHVRRWGPAIA